MSAMQQDQVSRETVTRGVEGWGRLKMNRAVACVVLSAGVCVYVLWVGVSSLLNPSCHRVQYYREGIVTSCAKLFLLPFLVFVTLHVR